MGDVDKRLRTRAVVSRAMVLAAGGSDDLISARVRRGWWTALHAGVYRIGPPTNSWMERLEAGLLACGEGAVVSHRAAWRLWDLDGLSTRLVEVTVPYTNAPVPEGVLRHRTRRRIEAAYRHGLAVTPIERTLLDVAPLVPVVVLAKGVDSAIRQEVTSHADIARTLAEKGGRGVRGTGKLLSVIDWSERSGPTGSPAEVELLTGMRRNGIPEPTPQWEVAATSGQTYRVDFGWPDLLKGVEVDGYDAHAGRENLERDLKRQNALLDAGVQLRRFTAQAIRNDLDGVLSAIARFLAS